MFIGTDCDTLCDFLSPGSITTPMPRCKQPQALQLHASHWCFRLTALLTKYKDTTFYCPAQNRVPSTPVCLQVHRDLLNFKKSLVYLNHFYPLWKMLCNFWKFRFCTEILNLFPVLYCPCHFLKRSHESHRGP